MIMFNRVINRVMLSVICIIFILYSTMSIADNSQFHKKEYQEYSKQDKPIFQSSDLATVLIWTGLDITKEITHVIETTNYIHKINPDLHFTTISHKTEAYKFIGVDMMALYIVLRNGVWSVYNVPFDDQYNYITKLYHSMLIEFYKSAKECPSIKAKPNEFQYEEGMTM